MSESKTVGDSIQVEYQGEMRPWRMTLRATDQVEKALAQLTGARETWMGLIGRIQNWDATTAATVLWAGLRAGGAPSLELEEVLDNAELPAIHKMVMHLGDRLQRGIPEHVRKNVESAIQERVAKTLNGTP